MHSFWAREAERSFLQAAALDPAAPMPYRGIAMVAAGDSASALPDRYARRILRQAGSAGNFACASCGEKGAWN